MASERSTASLPVRAARYGAWWLGQQARTAFWARQDARELAVGDASAVVPTPTAAAAQRAIALDREERPFARRVVAEVHESDVVWDVGACVGTYAALFADVAAHVVAVEPAPSNAALLSRQFDARDDVSVAEVALGETSGTDLLGLVDSDAPGAQQHTLTKPEGEVVRSVTVPVRRADDLVDHVPEPDVLKLDVEGAGLAALRGFGDLLDEVRVVAVEPHDNLVQLSEWLQLSGFDVEGIPLAGIRDGEHSLLATRDGGGGS